MKSVIGLSVLIAFYLCNAAYAAGAKSCAYCRSTTTLRDVNGVLTCKKHRCAKHGFICPKGMCDKCRLERLIKNRSAKCDKCGKIGVGIVSYGRYFGEEKWGVLCPDHYCVTHAKLRKECQGKFVCEECESASASEKLKQELQLSVKNRNAEIAAEQGLYDRMNSLFGMKLGDEVQESAGMIYRFKPNKQFRQFTEYYCTVGGRTKRIDSICAIMTCEVLNQQNLEEIEIVRLCLEKKFGCKMRKDAGNDQIRYYVNPTNKNLDFRDLSIEFEHRSERNVLKIMLSDSKLSGESLRENIKTRENSRSKQANASLDAL